MIDLRTALKVSAFFLGLVPAVSAQSPSTSSETPARAFWAKPTTFADFVALNIRSTLQERARPFGEAANHDFFQNEPYGGGSSAKVWVDAASQAITVTLDFNVERSLKPATAVCSFFLNMIGTAVGAGYPQWARNNLLSHYLPPSAFPADTAIQGEANDYLLKRMIARVVVFESANKRLYRCERNILDRDVVVREDDVTP